MMEGYADEGYDDGSDGYDGSEDAGYAEAPEWLGPIQERMDELREQNLMVAQQLSELGLGYADDHQLDDDDDDVDVDEGEPIHVDLLDAVNDTIDGRMADLDAERAIEDRDVAFDELRDELPLLLDDRAAAAIVGEARRLAEAWDPDIVNGPGLVHLIELVAKASIGDRARAREAPASAPRIVLESGQGAAPQEAHATADDWGDRIVEAANRLRPRI